MFWKFNLIAASHLETILSKENVTLQELMDEEDILQECKAQNKSLIEFLGRPEIMEEMVNLIVNEPPNDIEERVKFKYANIAAELLTSDVPHINDALASNESLLNKLYSFLETEKPLNPLLASFFSKTLGILLSRKTELIFEFLKSKEDFLSQLINHLKTSAIMDLLLRLVTCPESATNRLSILMWMDEQKTIQRLVALVDPCSDEERHANAAQTLCDVIRMAREQMAQLQEKADPDPLLHAIEATETISQLVQHMFNGGKNESAIVCGILILLTLLEVKKPGNNQPPQQPEQASMYFLPECQENFTALDAERLALGINHAIAALMPHLKDFHHLLLEPPPKKAIPMTIGILDPPLGNTRVHVARLVCSLLATNTHAVNVELAKLNTFDVLLDLFFKYSWNNFLHTQLEQSIGLVLSNQPTDNEEGKQEHPLLIHLFHKSHLMQRILDAWEENEQAQSKTGGHRKGYMGHLIKIANHIAKNCDSGTNANLIKEQIKELPEEYQKKWDAYIIGPLADVNKKNDTPLVGGPPLHSSSEDGDLDYRDMNMPQETGLQQFGFNDDEFGEHEDSISTPVERLTTASFHISPEENARNEELFEQTCNERVRPFDDPVNDDVWEEREHGITFSNVVETRTRKTARAGSEDPDSSSEEDDDDRKTSASNPGASNSNYEIKMDVDQAQTAWSTSYDMAMDVGPVAMDTGSPWESPVQSDSVPSQETGWADFANFADFESSSFSSSERTEVPRASVVMEMSDDRGFQERGDIAASPMATSLGMTQTSGTSVSTMVLPESESKSPKYIQSGSVPCLTLPDAPAIACSVAAPLAVAESGPAPVDFVSSAQASDVQMASVQENGPSGSNTVVCKSEKIEDTRGKPFEEFEKMTTVVSDAPNGPA